MGEQVMGRFKALVLGVALSLPLGASAQSTETLADIRQQLAVVFADIQRLRQELNTTGTPDAIGGATGLERLNNIEAEVQRLVARVEDLDFRINRVVTDGTNRIGDLEFRLCEIEPGCDIGALGETPSLGGVDIEASIPTPAPPPETGGPALAVGEQADFERAQEALASGDFRGAAEQFATYVQTYPGGPLTSQAQYQRGEALTGAGDVTGAARAYLEAFSGDPTGATAPDALFKLGSALASLGQTQDACITLNEVGTRFPNATAALDARSLMQNLGCQ
jgi:tol-pal system protein YbgF